MTYFVRHPSCLFCFERTKSANGSRTTEVEPWKILQASRPLREKFFQALKNYLGRVEDSGNVIAEVEGVGAINLILDNVGCCEVCGIRLKWFLELYEEARVIEGKMKCVLSKLNSSGKEDERLVTQFREGLGDEELAKLVLSFRENLKEQCSKAESFEGFPYIRIKADLEDGEDSDIEVLGVVEIEKGAEATTNAPENVAASQVSRFPEEVFMEESDSMNANGLEPHEGDNPFEDGDDEEIFCSEAGAMFMECEQQSYSQSTFFSDSSEPASSQQSEQPVRGYVQVNPLKLPVEIPDTLDVLELREVPEQPSYGPGPFSGMTEGFMQMVMTANDPLADLNNEVPLPSSSSSLSKPKGLKRKRVKGKSRASKGIKAIKKELGTTDEATNLIIPDVIDKESGGESRNKFKAPTFKCEVCGKVVVSLKNIELHRRTHTGDFPFECEICLKTFRDTSGLRSHALRTHRLLLFSKFKDPMTSVEVFDKRVEALLKCVKMIVGEPGSRKGSMPYACRLCGKRYSTLNVVDDHMLQSHYSVLAKALVNLNSQICTMPTKQLYKYLMSLVNEAMTNQEEDGLICGFCGAGRESHELLNLHIKAHLRISLVRDKARPPKQSVPEDTLITLKIKCDSCGTYFEDLKSLYEHKELYPDSSCNS